MENHFTEGHQVLQGEVDVGSGEHVYMETLRARALPRDDGGLRIHSATELPGSVQKAVSAVAGLPMPAVEIEVARVRGGFGGRQGGADDALGVPARPRGEASRLASVRLAGPQ